MPVGEAQPAWFLSEQFFYFNPFLCLLGLLPSLWPTFGPLPLLVLALLSFGTSWLANTYWQLPGTNPLYPSAARLQKASESSRHYGWGGGRTGGPAVPPIGCS